MQNPLQIKLIHTIFNEYMETHLFDIIDMNKIHRELDTLFEENLKFECNILNLELTESEHGVKGKLFYGYSPKYIIVNFTTSPSVIIY